jgi:hypothetical protein
MSQSTITFIINKVPYALNATNVEAIRKMPSEDRQQLVALLEAIKRVDKPAVSSATPAAVYTPSPTDKPLDPDALMAQLAMEDKLNKKPVLTTQSLYKWVAGISAIVIILILIFN